MFSKEWKLVGLSLLAVSFLTACPGHKNKKRNGESSTPFAGMWVNSNAHERLSSLEMTSDARFCHQLNYPDVLRKLGLSRADLYGDIVLDAWVIKGNGEVFLYTPVASSAGYRERYYVGSIASSNYSRKDGIRTGNVAPSYGGEPYAAPFSRGNAVLSLANPNQLTVWTPGKKPTTYTRINSLDQLNRISAALSLCNDVLDFGDNYHQERRHRGSIVVGPAQPIGVIPGPAPAGRTEFAPPAEMGQELLPK